MRRALMIGGSTAALLLALGASACGSDPASSRSVAPLGATSTPGATAAVATSAHSPGPPAGSSGSASTSLTWLAMTSRRNGYGMFERVAGNHCEAESGVTTDAGAHFGDAAVITTWNCNDNPPVTRIATDAAGDAFAYGPKLFIELGGRGRWRASPERGTMLSVSAVGRSVWLLRAACRGSVSTLNDCKLRLARSANGGRSWQAVPAPPGPATLGGQSQGWLLRTGELTAYIAPTPAFNNRGKPDSAAIWYTGNGGRHWSKRRLPCGIDAVSDAVATAGATLAAVCADEPSAGSQVKTTATSGNGGRTWTLHVGCLFRPGCRDPLYTGYLGDIAAVSQHRIYLAGDRSSLLVTADGGARWHSVTPIIGDDSGGTGQVIFFGRAHGLVTGQGGATNEKLDIFRTSDGGRTWSKVVPTLS